MPTILYWNMQGLSTNRFLQAATEPTPATALFRQAYFMTILQQTTPDIIALVEVSASNQFGILDGTLLWNPPSMNVLTAILQALQVGGQQWSLVPPLYVGDGGFREGVAVFFRSDRLVFTGPFAFGQTPTRGGWNAPRGYDPTNPPAGVQQIAYPGGWTGALPVAAVPAPGPLYNQGVAQDQLAAQFQVFDENGVELFFPNGRPLGVGAALSRSPYITTFYEPASGRNYKVCTVHTSPAATVYSVVGNLANISALRPNTPAGVAKPTVSSEHVVVIGDFNLDQYDANAFGVSAAGNPLGYQPLLNLGYELVIDSRPAGAAPSYALRAACMTHLMPVGSATCFSDSMPTGSSVENAVASPGAGGQPGSAHPWCRGYQGSAINNNISYAGCLDNALVLQPATDVLQVQAAILNVVSGHAVSPQQQFGLGWQTMASAAVQNAIANGLDPNNTAPAATAATQTLFQDLQHLAGVRSLTDHLPLLVQLV